MVGFYILLSIIIYIITVGKSLNILENAADCLFSHLINSGIIINIDDLNTSINNILSKEPENKKILILILIPFINILYAKIYVNIKSKKIIKDIKENVKYIKLNKVSIDRLNNIKNKKDRVREYAKLLIFDTKLDEQKNMFFELSKGTMYLCNPPLPAYSYSYYEVLELNQAIKEENNIKFGYMNGIKIAILGLSKNYELINVKLGKDNVYDTYDFKEMSEEEARSSKFVVYPLLSNYEEDTILQDACERILANRKIFNEKNLDNIENIRSLKKTLK